MVTRRSLMLICAIAGCALGASRVRADAGPQAVPQALYDVLLKVMRQGTALGFAGRQRALEPELRRDYDLAFMTRVVVGPPWRSMSPEEQQGLVAAFSDYTIATYASRFKAFSGERFTVDPATSALPSGDTIVRTKLVPHDGDPIELDYLLRSQPEGWRIIDVLLNGTVSEMAERRSEYSAALRDGGAAALTRMLQQKSAALAN
jgi:phospholipid transport system substrate-binding protein